MSGERVAPVQEPVLKISPLFAGLSELEFNAVAAFLEPSNYRSGDIIFSEGTQGEEIFILVSGKVSAWVGQINRNRGPLFEIMPGDFFGEMSIIANENRSATMTAREDTELLALQGIDFFRLIFEHPMIGIKLLRNIGKVQNAWLEETAKYLNDLMRWGETARRRAVSDGITGLYNRSFLDASAKKRFEHGFVGLRSISLLMMDLDKFHDINRKYGPKTGDLVFVSTADILRTTTRSGDICARLAGDEFAVLLPDTGPNEALIIAERIRLSMASKKVTLQDNPETAGETEISVNVSIGVASAPNHAHTWEELFLVADKALCRSKELGRNRVEIAV